MFLWHHKNKTVPLVEELLCKGYGDKFLIAHIRYKDIDHEW